MQIYIPHTQKRSLINLVHFVINISQESMYSADIWKCLDSVLGHEDCLAANSKSTGPPQKSADDQTVQSLKLLKLKLKLFSI